MATNSSTHECRTKDPRCQRNWPRWAPARAGGHGRGLGRGTRAAPACPRGGERPARRRARGRLGQGRGRGRSEGQGGVALNPPVSLQRQRCQVGLKRQFANYLIDVAGPRSEKNVAGVAGPAAAAAANIRARKAGPGHTGFVAFDSTCCVDFVRVFAG